jgi:predicted dehydrogenase
MSKIRLGVIGAGMAWERLHLPALERLGDKFKVVAVCDRDLGRAKRAADRLGLPSNRVYGEYNEMLSAPEIEAVNLMVPITENYEAAKAVISSKKHLIAEKPFAATVKGAKELAAAAKKAKLKVLVAENNRYDEASVIIKSIINEGRIGNVIYFIDNTVTEFQKEMLGDTFQSAEWRRHADFRGGVFMDSAIHNIARQRFLFGDVQCVHAVGRSVDADFAPYSCLNALLKYDKHVSGHFAYCVISRETQAPLVGLRIYGTNGEVYLEDKDCGFVNVSYKEKPHEVIPYTPGEGYYHELNNFYEAVANGGEIVSTPQKAVGDIQTIHEMLDKAEKMEAA